MFYRGMSIHSSQTISISALEICPIRRKENLEMLLYLNLINECTLKDSSVRGLLEDLTRMSFKLESQQLPI